MVMVTRGRLVDAASPPRADGAQAKAAGQDCKPTTARPCRAPSLHRRDKQDACPIISVAVPRAYAGAAGGVVRYRRQRM